MGKTRLIGLALASLLASTAVSPAAVLESPADGAALSGIGFIAGWNANHRDEVTTSASEPLVLRAGCAIFSEGQTL